MEVAKKIQKNYHHKNTGINKNLGIFLIFFLVYLINQFILKSISGSFFVHGHLNHVLVSPMLLSYANILFYLLLPRYKGIKTLKNILLFMGVVGFYWQYIAPVYYPVIVSDPWDIVANLLGALLYYVIIRKERWYGFN